MKDILLGIVSIVLVMGIIILFSALVFALLYAFGYTTGWVLHLMVGPDILFGMTFEQFIGVVFVIAGVIGATIAGVIKPDENKKSLKDALKDYRGY